jgi:hypothetical protein
MQASLCCGFRTYYKKWRILVNAWRSSSSPAALLDFLDFTKNGEYPDGDAICISHNEYGRHRVN